MKIFAAITTAVFLFATVATIMIDRKYLKPVSTTFDLKSTGATVVNSISPPIGDLKGDVICIAKDVTKRQDNAKVAWDRRSKAVVLCIYDKSGRYGYIIPMDTGRVRSLVASKVENGVVTLYYQVSNRQKQLVLNLY